jgi:MFS family permease
MRDAGEKIAVGSGLALAGVQFFFTLGWVVYVIYLPGLLKGAGLAASWLPWLLMADQLIFALMDIAFGLMADRMANAYHKLARLLLLLTTVSAIAFLLLPQLGESSSGILLFLLAVWVVSASVVRAPTLVLLAKRAKAAQQAHLVIWYSAGMALAMALSPFVGLTLKGVDPRVPFALSAFVLLLAVWLLTHVVRDVGRVIEVPVPAPMTFAAYFPLLLVLAVATFGFQVHAFINTGPLYLAQASKEGLPWLMPILWLGFFAALLGVDALLKRFGSLPVAAVGLLLTAVASYAAAAVNGLNVLIFTQLLAGAAWALAFAGLMGQASAAGTRGAEGLFMGSFFAMTALASLARIGMGSQLAAAGPSIQFVLPAAVLLVAGLCAVVYRLRMPQSR